MAQECWNKIHIPFPSAVSTSRIPFTGSVDLLIDCLLADCEKVLTLLCSEVLQTEIRVLYELLYVLNNGFRQHKPFRALKQVEQCVNRLKEMKLQAALEDLKEVCPNKFQREAGAEAGDCDVPSQPMLEWLGLKLVGASSLLARTLERCTKAFILTRQHLRLAEFIVLNVVITSMLSRLWTFFRGILGALIPMYRRITELLQNVAQSQPMTYLTDFTLPKDLKDFLWASYPDLQIEEAPSKTAKKKKKSKFSLLSKLFKETEQEDDNREEMMIPVLAADPYEGSSLDLGAAVSQRRPDVSPYGLDIKIMLQQSCKTTKQISLEKQMKLEGSVYQKRRFLKSLKEVSSFRNMAVQLKEIINWCRSCKFNQERKRLAFLSLRCLRMESLEAEGVRVERRLKTFKLKVQKTLMLQKTKPNRSFTAFWRTRWQNRFFLAHYKTLKPRSTKFRKSSTVKHSVSLLQTSKVVVSDKNVSVAKEQLNSPTTQKDDIDDIFESFGF